MLKHTASNGQQQQPPPPNANGQLRNNSNSNGNNNATNNNSSSSIAHSSSANTSTVTSSVASPSVASASQPAVPPSSACNTNQSGCSSGGTMPQASSRSIHLRPQQPLNISTLSASSLMATATGSGGTASSTPATTTTPLTPLTPNGGVLGGGAAASTNLNGGCNSNNNMHTYTNQHMLAKIVANGHIPGTGSSTQTSSQTASTTMMPPPPLPPMKHLAMLQKHNHNNSSNHTHNNNKNVIPTTMGGNTTGNGHAASHNNYSNCNTVEATMLPNQSKHGPGPREALTSLGLLCLVSLLVALLSLIFLLKISPNGREEAISRSPTDDFVIVYDVTLALCALSLSLNLCCLLVCAIQFLFAVKLVRSPMFDGRDNKYLEKSSVSRTCAVGGFFISIPIFLTGIILYTFNHFHSTPAIITSILIGIGIVFCGAAMVHNVFVWQKEKTISYRSAAVNKSLISHIGPIAPPAQFLNSTAHSAAFNYSHVSPVTQGPAPTPTHLQQLHAQNASHYPTYATNHPASVTPVSPNHSHGSFNALMTSPPAGGCVGVQNASYIIRPSTATPPTPKSLANGCLSHINAAREASGSVSPCILGALDMSNITSPSLHELSTLV